MIYYLYKYYMRYLLQYEFDIALWVLKIIIVLLWLIDFFLEYMLTDGNHIKKKYIEVLRNKISFWFSFFMGLLLVYMFNPWRKIPITIHTRYTLFLFGIIYIINLNWNLLFSDKFYLLKVTS